MKMDNFSHLASTVRATAARTHCPPNKKQETTDMRYVLLQAIPAPAVHRGSEGRRGRRLLLAYS